MATYKVIQDIEADDKLVGPLSLKQFIFAGVAAGLIFVAFMVASKTVIYAAIPFVPFIVIFGALAAPLGRDQPTEVWLAAQIRFLTKPRKRIWDQSDMKELVKITAPKKVQKILTKSYSDREVKSRLKALTETIDSRGWATKNVNLNTYRPPVVQYNNEERLVGYNNLSYIEPETNISAADDIMDYQNNPVAQQFEQMVQRATIEHKQRVIANMQKSSSAVNSNQTPALVDSNEPAQQRSKPIVTKEQTEEFLAHAKEEQKLANMVKPHHKMIKTPDQAEKDKASRANTDPAASSPPPKNPAIIGEYSKTDDLSIASLQHLVNRQPNQTNEVVIHLR
jgi:hypothetical protein